ncbi:hypothetical protein [Lacisediminihabitans sp.]|uniref:hypothetical protein n=1 Tax=Lacisediminihabitans sp. TaxID=2787631 RepID=UPI002F92ACC3
MTAEAAVTAEAAMSVAPTASAQTTSTIPATKTATVPRTRPSFSAIVPTASSTTEGSNLDSSLLPGGAATVTVAGLATESRPRSSSAASQPPKVRIATPSIRAITAR